MKIFSCNNNKNKLIFYYSLCKNLISTNYPLSGEQVDLLQYKITQKQHDNLENTQFKEKKKEKDVS